MKLAGSPARALVQLARLGAVGVAALALVASTEEGERAGTGGRCPAGETCSDATPSGLLFEGAPLGTWPALTAHTIAAGGRQTFRLTDPDTHLAFDLPFTAKVTNRAHAVAGQGDDLVVVGASSAATGYLRILDLDGLLYDRLAIDSAEVASVRAAPAYATAYPSFDPPRWAAFAGGQATVSLVLTDAAGQPVVDEGLTVRSPVPSTRTAWDSFQLGFPSAGVVALAVDAGHLAGQAVTFPVVESFDELEASAPADAGIGGTLTVCFTAWQRGPRADTTDDDTVVIGVPRRYRVTGPATPLAEQPYGSCVELHTDAAGTVQVDATVGDRTWSAQVEVRGAGMREAAGWGDWLRAPSEGERAAMAHD
ncbi:MAG TPA: hypothetical protein VHE35_19460 [Kofleriaceae bacterium]|nr:hypothetical protein [Kofleriaceae bacterium]